MNKTINNEINKKINFKVKNIIQTNDDGIKEIIGIANKYNVVDYHGDITDENSFIETIKNTPAVPLLWGHEHKNPIGIAYLESKKDGLWAKMQINTNITVGKEAYEISKQMQKSNRPMQLSIGYTTIETEDKEIKGNIVRYLKQVEVNEVSLVPLGANPESEVQEIKSKNTNNFNILQKEILNLEIEEILQGDENNKMTKNLNDKLKELRNQKLIKKEELNFLKKGIETKADVSDEDVKKVKELVKEINEITTEFNRLEMIKNEIEQEVIEDNQTEQPEKSRNIENFYNYNNYENKSILQNTDDVLKSKEYKNAWLKKLQHKKLTNQETKFLQIGTNSNGNQDASPLVPTTIWESIIAKLQGTSDLIKNVSVSNIDGFLKFAIKKDENVGGKWSKEGEKLTGKLDFESIQLNGYRWGTMITISESAEAMTIDNFEKFIIDSLAIEVQNAIEYAIAKGQGSAKLEPQGIITNTNILKHKLAQTEKNISYDTIQKIISLLPTGYHNNAKFIMNKSTFFTQIQAIKDKNDRPIWNHTKSDETLKYNIFGYDVILCDEYPEYSETEKSTFITFGDLSQYKWNFQKQLNITKSTDFLFDQDLIAYKATFIADGNTVAKWAFVNVVRE